MPDPDGQLYIRFLKRNDEEAFRVLYEKYNESLALFLNGIVQNIDDAEELMMDTFAVLFSGTARYKERDNSAFKTWLFAIARNQARMFLRRQHKKAFSELDENMEDGSIARQPEQTYISNESNAHLYLAMKKLPPDYRQVLYLSYFEEMKPDEIGRVMKKTVKQIYNLTSRGKTALKEILENMGYTRDI